MTPKPIPTNKNFYLPPIADTVNSPLEAEWLAGSTPNIFMKEFLKKRVVVRWLHNTVNILKSTELQTLKW